jgi:DNA-binding NarL/FixJ family response regulator
MAQPRVFLVDDHELILSGIRSELAGSVDLVGEADEVDVAIEMILERTPNVVLLDVHMPGGGGLAVLNAVSATYPAIRFLALSVSDAAEDVISIIRAGARGYVTKNISGPDLLDAIYRVAGVNLEAGDVDPELDQLTPRERQVLRLIARGYSYRDIGTELSISTKTVESHVSSVLRKLQLSNRHQLSHWASERHLN